MKRIINALLSLSLFCLVSLAAHLSAASPLPALQLIQLTCVQENAKADEFDLKRCTYDSQCPGAQVCLKNGLCGDRFGCTYDSQCPGAKICHNGMCGDRFGCTYDSQCPGSKICIDTFCVDR